MLGAWFLMDRLTKAPLSLAAIPRFPVIAMLSVWTASAVVLCANCRRLHDLGLSGWWQFAPAAAFLILGLVISAIPPINTRWVAITWMGLYYVVIFGLFVALGMIKGQGGPNRFGSPPQS